MTDGIQHVSDTARWVALYRAMESDRRDALFRDPYARRLAGERAERILAGMKRGREWAWPMIVRTAVMDELILRAIERDGVTTVLNLAAGLDARPYRLPLPPSLRWVEVDFPDVIAYKQEQLAVERPVCVLEQVGADLTDVARRRALFAEIGGAGRPVLVVTEGLLIYLTREQVAALADDLAAQPSFRWWLRHRLAGAAQDAGKDLGPRGGGGQRPVPVRARRGHGVLRAARVARSGVPLDVGGGAAPQADDAARRAVATGPPAGPEAQAGGGPPVL